LSVTKSRWFVIGAIFIQLCVYFIGYQHGVGNFNPTPAGIEPKVNDITPSVCDCIATESKSHIADSTGNTNKSLLEKIALLQNQYQALQEKQNLDEFSSEQKQELPNLLKQTLDQLPIDMIASRIERYIEIPQETFERMNDQRAFVNRLADVAMEGIITESDEDSIALLGPISFSDQYQGGAIKNIFSNKEVAVFAGFDTATFDKPVVLVKWYRTEDNKVFIFKQMPISPINTNYIWLTDQNGLEAGQYNVDIYDVSSQMNLLSRGSYQVLNYE